MKRTSAAVMAMTMQLGCYDWTPTTVDYARAHPFETMRVTDSVDQTIVADHVVVEGSELVLAPRPRSGCGYEDALKRAACYADDLAQRNNVPRVDYLPNPPRLERHELRAGKTALLVTVLVVGFGAAVTGIVALATYNNGAGPPFR